MLKSFWTSRIKQELRLTVVLKCVLILIWTVDSTLMLLFEDWFEFLKNVNQIDYIKQRHYF